MPTVRIETVRSLLDEFHSFMQTDTGQVWQQERQQKDTFFRTYFSETELARLDEGTIREMVHMLWAWSGWTNKDYLLDRMLASGLSTIRESFKILLFGDQPLSARFDFIRQHVNMMGAASISEILAHHDHQRYAIWTRRSRAGLSAIGISEISIPRSTQISGRQYDEFCRLVRGIRDQIVSVSAEFNDLFTLDFFLYFISLQEPSEEAAAQPTIPTTQRDSSDFDHNDVIDQVLELGDGLGFEVEREFTVTRGARIDALWRSRIANLGTIAYAFEVHRHGSRDSAILNLQRVRRDPTIQKLVLVSSASELEQFKEEITSLDEGFRNAVGYFEVRDLQTALDHLESLKAILRTIGLLNIERVFIRS